MPHKSVHAKYFNCRCIFFMENGLMSCVFQMDTRYLSAATSDMTIEIIPLEITIIQVRLSSPSFVMGEYCNHFSLDH